MHVKTVEELLSSQPMEFESVSGTITAIYERKTGGNEKRNWSVQNFLLKGSSGKTIRCALWNQGELDPGWKDLEAYIIAGKGKREVQMLATEFGQGQYADKLTLKVQDKATFTTKDPRVEHANPPPQVQAPIQPAIAAPAQPQPQVQHQNPAPSPATQRPPEPPQQQPANPRQAWAQADATLQVIRRGYLRCAMVANRILEDCRRMGIAFPDDGIQSMTATLFIQFKDRGGLLQVPNCDPMEPQHSSLHPANPPSQPDQPDQGDGTDSEYKY